MNKTEIDPYGEEIWEEDNEKWTIVRHSFPGYQDKSKKTYGKEEAKRLCDRWNRECDVYENYTIEKVS